MNMNAKFENISMILISFIVISIVSINAIPCDSCGNECASACGTKHFRTCCFNYLRKRADPDALKLSTNKRLIDFILLQGRALFTQNELSRAAEAEAEAIAETQKNKNNRYHTHSNSNNNNHNNNNSNKNDIFDVEMETAAASSYYG